MVCFHCQIFQVSHSDLQATGLPPFPECRENEYPVFPAIIDAKVNRSRIAAALVD